MSQGTEVVVAFAAALDIGTAEPQPGAHGTDVIVALLVEFSPPFQLGVIVGPTGPEAGVVEAVLLLGLVKLLSLVIVLS